MTDMLPLDLDAELAVIGAMLTDYGVIPEVRSVLCAADFHFEHCARMFREIVALYEQGELCITRLALTLGGDYATAPHGHIALAMEKSPNTYDVTCTARIVLELAERRRVIEES